MTFILCLNKGIVVVVSMNAIEDRLFLLFFAFLVRLENGVLFLIGFSVYFFFFFFFFYLFIGFLLWNFSET